MYFINSNIYSKYYTIDVDVYTMLYVPPQDSMNLEVLVIMGNVILVFTCFQKFI